MSGSSTPGAPRLVMVSHYFGSHRGGIELVAQRLAQELLALGQPLTWIASDASPAPTLDPPGGALALRACNIVEKKTGLPFPVPYPAACARLMREVRGAGVVLLHDCLYLANIFAFVAARRRRIPVVIVQHIGLVPYRNPFLRTLMRVANLVVTKPMLRRADQVVFISELTRGYFASVRFERKPITIFNGVDADVFHAAEAGARAIAREKLGLQAERPVVAFAGRFVEKKGVQIVRALAQRRPDLQFALAGHGPIDPEAWKLPNVRVYRNLSGATLADLYRAADVLVLPSTGEGFPLVVQEALACGLRVLCADDTATADAAAAPVLRHARVAPGDDAATVKGFLSELDAILAEPDRAEERRARSDFARQRYSWPAAAAAYRNLFMELHAATNRGFTR